MTLPSLDRYGFPLQVCGRCSGTGKHSYNQRTGDVCFGCDGHGVRHTPKAHKQFQAWSHALTAQRQVLGQDIQLGDELAILQAISAFNCKIVGWHTVSDLQLLDDACGWSISSDADGNEVRTPTAWRMLISFDDGETSNAATNNCFRRKGWIDPAPYVALSIPKRQKAVA
jgi:hypothetical protein